jgi:hypothetical protein
MGWASRTNPNSRENRNAARKAREAAPAPPTTDINPNASENERIHRERFDAEDAELSAE